MTQQQVCPSFPDRMESVRSCEKYREGADWLVICGRKFTGISVLAATSGKVTQCYGHSLQPHLFSPAASVPPRTNSLGRLLVFRTSCPDSSSVLIQTKVLRKKKMYQNERSRRNLWGLWVCKCSDNSWICHWMRNWSRDTDNTAVSICRGVTLLFSFQQLKSKCHRCTLKYMKSNLIQVVLYFLCSVSYLLN